MKRRTLLVTVGALAAGAGCVNATSDDESNPDDTSSGDTPSDGAPNDSPPTDGTPHDSTPTDGLPSDSTPDDRTPNDGTGDRPGEGDGAGASFDDIACPSFADSVDRTVCSHTDSDSDIYPTVSEAVFTPTTDDNSVETLAIRVHNESGATFEFNPYEWALKRQTADGWVHVAPEEYVEPLYRLPSGETYTWELGVESHPKPGDNYTTTITEDLDSGTYAFQMIGFRPESEAEPSQDGEIPGTVIECITLFRVSRT